MSSPGNSNARKICAPINDSGHLQTEHVKSKHHKHCLKLQLCELLTIPITTKINDGSALRVTVYGQLTSITKTNICNFQNESTVLKKEKKGKRNSDISANATIIMQAHLFYCQIPND